MLKKAKNKVVLATIATIVLLAGSLIGLVGCDPEVAGPTLTVTPESGYSISETEVSTRNLVTIVKKDDKSVTESKYSLTVGISPSGNNTITLSGGTYTSEKHPAGSTITLTATPASGYTFSGWSGSASGSQNPLTINIDGDKSITANFSEIVPISEIVPGIAWGVNLRGLEWGDYGAVGGYGEKNAYIMPNPQHGDYGEMFTVPIIDSMDYFKSKGITVFRLPFIWERVQHSLYADLDPEDLGYLDEIVDAAAARGLKIILDPHNFARYYRSDIAQWTVVGSSETPASALADFWRRMAEHYVGNPGVYGYSLTNEPHDLADGSIGWKNICQETIDAIRQVDTTTSIIIPGYQWSTAHGWTTWAKSTVLAELIDSSDNLIFEAHQYLDIDGSGRYQCEATDVSPTVGIDRLTRFVDWLRENGKKGMIGEIGVPPDQEWLDLFETTLDYISTCSDVLVNVQIWAAQPQPSSYIMNISPDEDGNDKPQMTLLNQYIKGVSD